MFYANCLPVPDSWLMALCCIVLPDMFVPIRCWHMSLPGMNNALNREHRNLSIMHPDSIDETLVIFDRYYLVNLGRAEFTEGNIKVNLDFLPILSIEIAQVFEIFSPGRQEPVYLA